MTILDVKAMAQSEKISRAIFILTPLATTSYEARALLIKLRSTKKLTAAQWKRIYGEGGYEQQYTDKFGAPEVPPSPPIEVPTGRVALQRAQRALGGPKQVSPRVVPQPESLDALRPYEEETTPLRRAAAYAQQHGIQLLPTASIAPVFPFSYFNPVQTQAFSYLDQPVNLLVCAPTSSGKTEIAAVYAARAIQSGFKAVYLSPMRALSSEKHDLWSDPNYLFGDYKVTLHTGDWQLTASRRAQIAESDLLLFTSEILDSQSRYAASHPEQDSYLGDVGVILCDEAHLLGTPGRGGKLEAALIRLADQAPSARLVLLSATLANAQEISEWIGKITKRETVLIQSDFRPTQLDTHLVPYQASFQYVKDQQAKISSALALAQEHSQDQFIFFCHTKRDLRALTDEGKKRGLTILQHYADLGREKRQSVEESFRSGRTRLLAATSTLAAGVNQPARRVVILGISRGPEKVSPSEIQQECGRAGRAGLDPRGDAHILVPSSLSEEDRERLLAPESAQSELGKWEVLAFHLLAEVRSGRISYRSLLEWYKKSLRAQQIQSSQALEETLRRALSDLVEMKCLESHGDRLYHLLELGEISAIYYFSPYDCYYWKENFRELWERECWDQDWSIAWAIGNVPTYHCDFVPQSISNGGYPTSRHSIQHGSLPAIVAVYEGIRGGVKQLPQMGLINWWAQISGDGGRIAHVLELIQQSLTRVMVPRKELEMRLRKGVPRELTSLARIPGVGSEYARRLFEYGIKTPEQVLDSTADLTALLGKRADTIRESARRLLEQGDEDGDRD